MKVKTAFPKIPHIKEHHSSKWIFYFHAGLQWLETYKLVRDNNDLPHSLWFVESHTLYFSIELFIKSWAAKENPSFNAQIDKDSSGKTIGHRATAIIEEYKEKIPELNSLYKNKYLFNLIKIYEGTLVTRFGETSVAINGDDTKLLYETGNQLANDLNFARKK